MMNTINYRKENEPWNCIHKTSIQKHTLVNSSAHARKMSVLCARNDERLRNPVCISPDRRAGVVANRDQTCVPVTRRAAAFSRRCRMSFRVSYGNQAGILMLFTLCDLPQWIHLLLLRRTLSLFALSLFGKNVHSLCNTDMYKKSITPAVSLWYC